MYLDTFKYLEEELNGEKNGIILDANGAIDNHFNRL